MKRIAFLLPLTVLGACAVTKMDAHIDPHPQIVGSNIGAGREVGVMVVDERPRQDIGRRAAGGGNIRMEQDPAPVYQAAIIQGLHTKGFNAIAGHSNQSNLKVEIRGLAADPSIGLWTVGSDMDSTIKGIAVGPSGAPYENMYRANTSNRTMFVSGAKSTNAKLNDVVNRSLSNLLNDNKLLETLAAK